MDKLSAQALKNRLSELDEWKLSDNQLIKTFIFQDFGSTMVFVNKVAELAEQANHHPDIHIAYNKVTLGLSTHSAGGLTSKDFELARKIIP